MDAATDRLKGYKALATADIAFDENLGARRRLAAAARLRGGPGSDVASRTAPSAIFLRQRPDGDRRDGGGGRAGTERAGDLSVMGYDDQELARYTHPPLSTLVQPNYEMGQELGRRHGKTLETQTMNTVRSFAAPSRNYPICKMSVRSTPRAGRLQGAAASKQWNPSACWRVSGTKRLRPQTPKLSFLHS